MLIVLKVVLAPLLVALCTFVGHRWGSGVGGWLLGLPLTSGPVSVFLLLEHGPGFARTAASGTLIGLVAAGAFCACYTLMAERWSWWKSLLVASVACLATGFALAEADPGFAWRVGIVLIALGVFAWFVGAPREATERPEPTASDLALRITIAGVVVFAVTTGAALLGSSVAGMLAPLPIIAAIMAASLHRRSGREMADNLLRGTLAGTWGGAAFFAVVASMMAPSHVLGTYALATVAALLFAAVAARLRIPAALAHAPRLSPGT